MNIKVAKTAGVCFGVNRAVEIIEKCSLDKKHKYHTLGPIIHNPDVVNDMKNKDDTIKLLKDLNLDIQDITAGHIFDYVNYLSNDGGRKDNKIGGQSATSIRKIISILRQVFEYAVLYGDIKINLLTSLLTTSSKVCNLS